MTAYERFLEEYMTEEQMAKALGIEIGTLRNRIGREKDIPKPIKTGNTTLFEYAEFKRYLNAKKNKAS